MGRLIDANELLKEFDPNGERLDPILVRSRIVQQPTAYNPEKVVEELKEANKNEVNAGMCPNGFIHCLTAIDIVEKGGVE